MVQAQKKLANEATLVEQTRDCFHWREMKLTNKNTVVVLYRDKN